MSNSALFVCQRSSSAQVGFGALRRRPRSRQRVLLCAASLSAGGHWTRSFIAWTSSSRKLVQAVAAPLLAVRGVGVDTAGALLVAAGDNPERLSSEASFAALCGVSPVDASSGRQHRHRLNRGGNREANRALWVIAIVRMASDPATRTYVQRRTREGFTKKEILRCLKRYIARQLYRLLLGPTAAPADASNTA